MGEGFTNTESDPQLKIVYVKLAENVELHIGIGKTYMDTIRLNLERFPVA